MINIKQPKYSKLPYSIHNGEYLDILDAKDCIVAAVNTHLNDEADSEYIVQACNNFPKAIELLKQSLKACQDSYTLPQGGIDDFTPASIKDSWFAIHEFLKSLDNE